MSACQSASSCCTRANVLLSLPITTEAAISAYPAQIDRRSDRDTVLNICLTSNIQLSSERLLLLCFVSWTNSTLLRGSPFQLISTFGLQLAAFTFSYLLPTQKKKYVASFQLLPLIGCTDFLKNFNRKRRLIKQKILASAIIAFTFCCMLTKRFPFRPLTLLVEDS